MRRTERWTQVRVGVFVLVGLVALVLVLVALGRSDGLFTRRISLHTTFQNTGGLVVGAPVRLAGVEVGVVQQIRFDPDVRVKAVHVVMRVQRQFQTRLRADSIARLTSSGLLGDMLIDITVGSADAPPLRDGGAIGAAESVGLAEVAAKVQETVEAVHVLARDLDQRLRLVLTEPLARDVGRTARALANVAERVERGPGLLHDVAYDERLSRSAAGLVDDARRGAGRLERVLAQGERVAQQVERGPGTLHGLLYDDEGTRLLQELRRAATALGEVVSTVQQQGGGGQVVADLGAASASLRRILGEVEQGKGTIGGLLKDPTVYQDLKRTLDNVERNTLLRALIRYTIKHDHLDVTAAGPIR